MRAADSRIPPVVVLSAGLHASSLVVDTITVAGAVAAVIASLVRCTALPVLVVVMKHRCLLSREATSLYIAVIVTRGKVVVALSASDRAGKLHDRSFGESR